MIIGGLQKTTLIDFPGKIACTVFTVGCNFRCPFCHNRNLVTLELFKEGGLELIPERDFFDFLKARKNWLEGVCITGGEPTIQKDLPQFCAKIKKLGFKVKLDTNGANPEMIKKLLKKKLVDYVAMDVKGSLDNDYGKYRGERGKKGEMVKKVKETLRLLVSSGVPFELRTTVVPTLHTEEILVRMAKEVREEVEKVVKVGQVEKVRWYLQQFRPKNCFNPSFEKIKPYSEERLKAMAKRLQKIIPGMKVRGAG